VIDDELIGLVDSYRRERLWLNLLRVD